MFDSEYLAYLAYIHIIPHIPTQWAFIPDLTGTKREIPHFQLKI